MTKYCVLIGPPPLLVEDLPGSVILDMFFKVLVLVFRVSIF